MNRLTPEAAYIYYIMSYISFKYRLIDKTEYFQRIKFLSESNDHPYYKLMLSSLSRNVEGLVEEEADGTEQEDQSDDSNLDERNHVPTDHKEEVNLESKQYSLSDSDLIYLLPIPGKYGARWIFHETDVDQRPTIPHGHSTNNNIDWTLDPYRGFIYDGDGRVKIRGKREPKKVTISLWNDENFREIAVKCLQFHIDHHFYHIKEIMRREGFTTLEELLIIPKKRRE